MAAHHLASKAEKYLPLLALIAFLPIMVLRDFSISNELRYLSIADEALRNGNIFTFTNNGLPYADKPPLYLWIVMAGRLLFGNHCMWFLSLFSLIPALMIMRIMRNWLLAECTLADKGWKLTSQLMLITCGMFLGLNVFLRMDTLMCLFIVLALRTFYRMYRGEGNPATQGILFPLYTFLAIFTKGPVGIMMPLICPLVFLLFKREGRTFFRYWNLQTFGILILLCGAWFLAAYMEGGGQYLDNLLFHQTAGRAVNAFHHKKPFYYYLIQIWPSLAPYCLLLIGVNGAAMLRHRFTSDTERFWNCIILSTFVMLSAVSGKLAVYLAPIIPFAVFLTVSLIRKFRYNGLLATTVALPAVVYAFTLPVLFCLARFTSLRYIGQPFFYAAAAILSVAGVWALCLLFRKRNIRRSLNVLGFAILLAAFAGGWSLPAVNSYIGYRDVCRKAVEISREKGLEGYYSLYLRRAENTDVFLHESITQMPPQTTVEELSELNGTALLLTEKGIAKNPDIKAFVSAKESYRVGPYRIVAL